MRGVRLLFVLCCIPAASCSCMDTETRGGNGEEDADHETPDPDNDGSDDDYDSELPEPAEMPPVCGNAVIDPGEECDDGNRLNGDGCDWMCRLGPGSFEYPPPDPDVPPVAPSGPPQVVTDADEMSIFAIPNSSDMQCHPLWLAAGGGGFALVYNYDQPYYGVRLRILERSGRTVGEPWSHETRWGFFQQALFPSDEGFGLMSGSGIYGLMRSRFDLDGSPLEELLPLRPPLERQTTSDLETLVSGAHQPGRWLAVSRRHAGIAMQWLLESFADDGSPAAQNVLAIEGSFWCVSAAATEDGFAVGDGNQVVVLDRNLGVASWSGLVSGGLGPGWVGATVGAMDLASDGYWIAWWIGLGNNSPDPKSLWVAALELDGTPRFPPRRILEGLPNVLEGAGPMTDAPEMAIADGPAGAAIVYWQGVGDGETAGGPVMLVTLDDWGNVITPPTPVLDEGQVTRLGWVLAADADELGYGVVTMVEGSTPGMASLVFRHFEAAP